MSKYIPRQIVNGKVYIEMPNEAKQEFHASRKVWLGSMPTYKKSIHGELKLKEVSSIPSNNKYLPKD